MTPLLSSLCTADLEPDPPPFQEFPELMALVFWAMKVSFITAISPWAPDSLVLGTVRWMSTHPVNLYLYLYLYVLTLNKEQRPLTATAV